jgi:ketosteroid isomerase-like protein
MPPRVEGKTACTALFTKVCEAVKVQFSNIIVYPLADPATVLVEYNGYGEPQGLVYDQTYITIFRFQAGKIILYKEYWNSVVVRDAFGDLSGMF